MAYGQSTLPPMSPTFAERVTHPASVAYAHGELEVRADNSSLNQILRDVSRQMGMKISGVVIDERVYGKYGPSSPAKVLASLLGGTTSNMLLVETRQDTPAELILTPRQGEVTPPNPKAPGFEDESPAAEAASNVAPHRVAVTETVAAPSAPAAVPVASASVIENTPPASPANSLGSAVDAPMSTTVQPTDQPQSPNGVKTPQQIFEQLQQLQQASAK
jgi:hypothetical protein